MGDTEGTSTEPPEASILNFRLLPPIEWHRLVEDGIEPFATYGLPPDEHWRVVVVEQDGLLVGASVLVETVQNHWDIRPSARRNPAVVLGLWRETKKLLDEHGVELIHATVSDSQPEVQDMIERLGYRSAEGKLYILSVADAVLNLKEA